MKQTFLTKFNILTKFFKNIIFDALDIFQAFFANMFLHFKPTLKNRNKKIFTSFLMIVLYNLILNTKVKIPY